jgi:hypothetical protein
MIFGNPKELAIECFVDEISNNICYGRLAILAKELYIGDISMLVILNTPVTFFLRIFKILWSTLLPLI